MKYFLPALFTTYLFISAASAQQPAADSTAYPKMHQPLQKFYIGGGMDGAIFSLAAIETIERLTYPAGSPPATTYTPGNLRFSWFLNLGTTFNFNFSRHIGSFTGIDIKNIGFIENKNGVVIKRRTYNLGIPIGLKIGDMGRKGAYMFVGGGVDLPLNYRQKSFIIRNQKTKFNEWFSDRTPHVMPYVFAGVMLRSGVTIKGQYYVTNYLNPEFVSGTVKPYEGYTVHPILLSIGFVKRYSKRPDMVKKHIAELKTM